MQLKQLVEALQPYQIKEKDIREWEAQLGLEIEVEDGIERYKPQHVQLFKSVKKQLSLGRTLQEIKSLLVLPARKDSIASPVKPELRVPEELKPTSVTLKNPTSNPSKYVVKAKTNIPAMPSTPTLQPEAPEEPSLLMNLPAPVVDPPPLRVLPDVDILELEQPSHLSIPNTQKAATGVTEQLKRLSNPQMSFEKALSEADSTSQHAGMLILIDRLVNDKDDLTAQVSELSRYNAHLNKVNLFYKRQLTDLENDLKSTEKRLQDLEKTLDARVRLYRQDDKARLQQQVIEAEKASAMSEHDARRLRQELGAVKNQFDDMANPNRFIGTWLETGTLRKVHFDTFGINIPESRSRLFRLTQAPERVYGQTAVIETQYDYRTNTLWKRLETLTVSLHPTDSTMMGELVVEYLLEGKTVAKASYGLSCQKQSEEARLSPSVDKI